MMPRRFVFRRSSQVDYVLNRLTDVSTTSTAQTWRQVIAWGIEFPDGVCVTHWAGGSGQTCVWRNIAELETLYQRSGAVIEWIDGPATEQVNA